MQDKVKNSSENRGINPGHPIDAEACFGLSEELLNPVKLDASCEELELKNYLQKLHIKNHVVSSKEVVHDLYSEESVLAEMDAQLLSEEDELLFAEVREAVAEKEIVDLRANLQSIAHGISIHERTFDEIEDFIDGELDLEIENQIREEAVSNGSLAYEIELHKEVNGAIVEQDVMKLRANLRAMMSNEYSHSRSVEDIDNYINDELDEASLALFDEEYVNNPQLAADLEFHREVDRAIAEQDVMDLRARLKEIAQEQNSQESDKLGISIPNRSKLIWYSAASVIVLMLVFASLVSNRRESPQNLYATYYQPYKGGESVSRSSSKSVNELSYALREMDQGNYSTALKWLESASPTDEDGYSINFYSGVIYQETGEYNSAINSFSKVVHHGDNLLVEQSEWYIGLCYLRLDEREKALAQFKSIIRKEGYYKDQSKKIIKQLE